MRGVRVKLLRLPEWPSLPNGCTLIVPGLYVGDEGYVFRVYYPGRLVAVRFEMVAIWIRAQDLQTVTPDTVVSPAPCHNTTHER